MHKDVWIDSLAQCCHVHMAHDQQQVAYLRYAINNSVDDIHALQMITCPMFIQHTKLHHHDSLKLSLANTWFVCVALPASHKHEEQ